MNNYEIKKQILDKIKIYDSIIIVRHVRPDGDCIGSSIGLREILRASFKEKKIYSIGFQKAEYLAFVGAEDEEVSEDVYKKSLIISLDTANTDRIDNKNYILGKEIIKIDHHIDANPFGDISYVDENSPATSCLICDFYKTFKDELIMTKEAALALYVAMVTDTGRFRYSGVNREVMELAGMLLDYDLDLEYIYAALYMKDVNSLKLQGEVFNKFKVTDNGVLYMYIPLKLQKKYNLLPEEASALINCLDSVKGGLIWIMFIEQLDNSIRVRLRSRFVSIVEIGEKYRGGGHANAAGGCVYNKKEMKSLVEMADSVIKEFKEREKNWL